jgi:hypothetical protein
MFFIFSLLYKLPADLEMSRPIGEISAVFIPAVGLQASDVSVAGEVTY